MRGSPISIDTRAWWVAALAGLSLALSVLPRSSPAHQSDIQPTAIRVDVSPQLFTALAALEAAGFEKDAPVPEDQPTRRFLRSTLLARQGPAVDAVREFYRSRAIADTSADQARYVSFGLLAEPPPSFKLTVSRNLIPRDVALLDGLTEVLIPFYTEAGIATLWHDVLPEYNRGMARVQPHLAEIVLNSTGYTRELLAPAGRRTFTVYVESLVGNRTQFRNDAIQYAIVVSPSGALPLGEIQQAFIQFLIDPIVFSNLEAIAPAEPLLRIAGRAPRLPSEYMIDFPGFFSKNLVRAIHIRMQRLPDAQREAAVSAAEQDGWVLVHALDQQLARYEENEPSLKYYFPDLVRGIDVAAEARRLQSVQFAALAPPPDENSAPQLSGLDRDLAEAERLIASGRAQAPAAQAAFELILLAHPGNPRAIYGIAIAALLQADVRRAKELLQSLVLPPAAAPDPGNRYVPGAQPDPVVLSWSHVRLGRIFELEGSRDLALTEYKAALAVPGAPEAARMAAQRGVEQGIARSPGTQ